MPVTEAFYEQYEPIAEIPVASHSAVQDLSARIFAGNYTEIVVVIKSAAGSGETIDVDIEEANALTGGTLQTFDSGNKDITVADGDTWNVIRLRGAEFTDGFDYLNVEATPSGARLFTVSVYGFAREKPADNTNYDSVTD